MTEIHYHNGGIDPGEIVSPLSLHDRLLPLGFCCVGICLGQLSAVHSFIEATTVGSMSLLAGGGLLAMMYPPLANVHWEVVTSLFRDWRLLVLLVFIIGPFVMFLLAAGIFHNDTGFMTGFSLVGWSRCIGMEATSSMEQLSSL
ncbi:LOW QUALITY PROTEIN: Arsenical-resistance protein [Phytophthora palmivora]|uniref:Arsenical-resistance protein n=1 Tax=Phytophthora palmivora TaxID=4796 RepID=A0A2P4YLX2_9STRA|nr:LOW QUALITY PROTEIN: Arsenical-resistance protein [Phytophthora palmivora]